jgi:hypothetical protein
VSSGDVRLRGLFPVRPGGHLVVEGAGLEASVEDADEPAGELAQGSVVLGAAGALGVVEGPGDFLMATDTPGELPSADRAWAISASMSRSLRMNRAATTFFFPDARVSGEVPA